MYGGAITRVWLQSHHKQSFYKTQQDDSRCSYSTKVHLSLGCAYANSGITGGVAGCPPGQGRKGKWREKEGKFKREEVENWKWKGESIKMSTKMNSFCREKAYFTPGKNREKWLCPLWKNIPLTRLCANKHTRKQCTPTHSRIKKLKPDFKLSIAHCYCSISLKSHTQNIQCQKTQHRYILHTRTS